MYGINAKYKTVPGLKNQETTTYREMDVWLHAFIIPAVHKDEWQPICRGRYSRAGRKPQFILDRSWVDSTAGL
jgi:hypothetical protein